MFVPNNILCRFSYKRHEVIILVSLEANTLNLLFSRLDSPNSLNNSLKERCSSAFIILTAFSWSVSLWYVMSLLY